MLHLDDLCNVLLYDSIIKFNTVYSREKKQKMKKLIFILINLIKSDLILEKEREINNENSSKTLGP